RPQGGSMARSARPTRFRGKWRIRWIDHEGHRRSAVFDLYSDADRELRARQLEAEQVRRGERRPTPKIERGHTVRDLCEYWLDHRAPLKRSKDDDRSMVRRHLIPSLGALKLDELGAEHVDGYIAARQSLSPKTVRNHLVLLSTMLAHAVAM